MYVKLPPGDLNPNPCPPHPTSIYTCASCMGLYIVFFFFFFPILVVMNAYFLFSFLSFFFFLLLSTRHCLFLLLLFFLGYKRDNVCFASFFFFFSFLGLFCLDVIFFFLGHDFYFLINLRDCIFFFFLFPRV